MNRAWLLPLLTAGCSIGPSQQKDTAFFCGEVALNVADAESLAGDVSVSVTLRQPDEEKAVLSLAYQLPDGHLEPATVGSELKKLSSSEEGETHAFVWDSAGDLGQGVFDALMLRAVASSDCGVWAEGVVEDLSIDNSAVPDDVCAIEVSSPSGTQEGEVVISFSLTHPSGPEAYVAATWSTDGGSTYQNLSLADADCDGDGDGDRLTGLSTSAEGQDHCLTWDSQLDLPKDASVQIRLACGVGYEEQDSAETRSFDLENDPLPGENEVLITEVMADPGATDGAYVELYNAAGHALDLNGVALRRWTSTADPDSSPASKEYVIDDPNGILLLGAGEYLLLAQSWDQTDNGCISPDNVWDSAFSLRGNSTLRLVDTGRLPTDTDDTVLFTLTMLDTLGFEFDEGVALGLDPDHLTGASANDVAWWCAQSSTIASCDAGRGGGDGTPGLENDSCR